MAKVKELTQLENRPGTLARLAKVLADARVNLLAWTRMLAMRKAQLR